MNPIRQRNMCCRDCLQKKEFNIKQDLFLFVDADNFLLREDQEVFMIDKKEVKKPIIKLDSNSCTLVKEQVKKIRETGKQAFIILFSKQYNHDFLKKCAPSLPEMISTTSSFAKAEKDPIGQINFWRSWHNVSAAKYLIISHDPKIAKSSAEKTNDM